MMAYLRHSLFAVFVLAKLLTLGCTNLSPSSECTLDTYRCDGAVAMYCDAVGGSKATLDTHNEWVSTDCAALGMICVGGDEAEGVGCAVSEDPCDPAEAAPRCEGEGSIAVCAGSFSVTGSNIPTGGLYTLLPCNEGTICQEGSASAGCAAPGAIACDPGVIASCPDANTTLECSSDGLGVPTPCEGSATCEQLTPSFAFCSAGTCDAEDATRCDADGQTLLVCWPAPGSPEALRWRPLETCAAACAEGADGASCTP